jgi:antitoxin PrlF
MPSTAAAAATMTTKGQVTFPKELRDRLGLRQGDVVEFIEENGKIYVRRAQSADNPFLKWAQTEGEAAPTDWLRDLRGWDDTDRELLG